MTFSLDYGIDLGTTNSAIAHQSGVQTEIISAHDGPFVPSVVHIAPDGVIRVGQSAMDRRLTDPANVHGEFKRLMGTSDTILFPAANRRMSPVELSAEILKELVARAERQGGGRRIEAAVITIPAMFQLPQCEATREAAELAGLRYAPLLQEPIAAAIASLGNADLRDGYWLVYDFGGGTFDVSLVRSRGGRMQVLDHDGDNHLGGKDFDRLLARRAADAIRAEGRIPNFHRSDPAFQPAFELLRIEAERVRIALSTRETEKFQIEHLAQGPDGAQVGVDFAVTRAELEEMIRPVIGRTVQLCRKMLERHDLAPSQLKRLVLVGGPTLTPALPRILEDSLAIEARHYVDPSKAVAIGAAIYASTQRVPAGMRASAKLSSGPSVELSYESMTNDSKPMVAGQLLERGAAGGDWRVRVISEPVRFESEWTPVRPDGAFAVRVQLEANRLNVFELQVSLDGTAVPSLTSPFSIIHGTTIAKPVLSQSVGVVLSDNSVRWYLKKGVMLPARSQASHTTTLGLRRGQTGTAVHVPLIQGESEFADRNIVVGLIEINADNIPHDLPVGSQVLVTLIVDEHSTTSAQAYVPLLDQTFAQIVKFGLETRSSQQIRKDVEGQQSRLAELEKMASKLEQEDGEGGIDDRIKVIQDLLEDGGADERNQADQILRNLTGMIDTRQVKGREEQLLEQFDASSLRILELLTDNDREESRQHVALSGEFNAAVARADLQLAESKLAAVKALEWALIRQQPGYWASLFEYLCQEVPQGPRAGEATVPIEQGRAAVKRNDLQALHQACMALIRLLPQQEQAQLPTVVRSHVS